MSDERYWGESDRLRMQASTAVDGEPIYLFVRLSQVAAAVVEGRHEILLVVGPLLMALSFPDDRPDLFRVVSDAIWGPPWGPPS